MIIPGAAVLAGLVDFAIACVVLVPLQIYYRILPTPHVLLLPYLVVLLALLATGVGMWLSALNVYYRDVRYAQPFLMQVWMFATPIIYPASIVPEKWRWLLALNPLTGIIDGFRAALTARPLDGAALAISTAATAVVLLYAAFSFRRMESRFADAI
jgi:lipopolysaccharide transport system permease protein